MQHGICKKNHGGGHNAVTFLRDLFPCSAVTGVSVSSRQCEFPSVCGLYVDSMDSDILVSYDGCDAGPA